MKKIILLTAVVLAALTLSGCGGNSVSRDIQVVLDDVAYPTEKFLRIGYTLKTWEYEKEDLELQKITDNG